MKVVKCPKHPRHPKAVLYPAPNPTNPQAASPEAWLCTVCGERFRELIRGVLTPEWMGDGWPPIEYRIEAARRRLPTRGVQSRGLN